MADDKDTPDIFKTNHEATQNYFEKHGTVGEKGEYHDGDAGHGTPNDAGKAVEHHIKEVNDAGGDD
jgi:hypothetical protein